MSTAGSLKRAPLGQKIMRKTRSRDPQESRRALIEAAGKIFNTVGYYGTDTNRIAVAAGYTPGTFYTHFADKREIFLEVYRGWVDAGLAATADARQKNATPSRRRELAKSILERHRKWRVFRASLRALYAIDDYVHQARLVERERQVDLLIETTKTNSDAPLSRAEAIYMIFRTEALCDAIVDGDTKALGVRDSEMFEILVESL